MDAPEDVQTIDEPGTDGSGSASFLPPRGMRDFFPEDMAARNSIFDAWATASRLHGFSQYEPCVVESLDLIKRKAGEEIVNQIYAFKDKSGRDIALRAEVTPSLARMVASRQGGLVFPLKWFTMAQCFRYERMSRGRKREHYQWNLDILGEASIWAEAEVIACAVRALSLLGLTERDVAVHVNSRALLSELLLSAGIPCEHHHAVFLALDKRGKMSDEDIADLLKDAGLHPKDVEATFGITRIASPREARDMLRSDTPAYTSIASLFEALTGYGVAGMVKFDISIVRGLGYYTGIVFEAFDTERKFRALFGGGRYDNLLSDIGGRPMTCVGMGFGDVVIAELLRSLGRTVGMSERVDIALGYLADEQRSTAAAIAQALRRDGKFVDMAMQSQKPKNFFSNAARSGCKEAIFLGPDELQRGTFRIKNLADRTERELPIAAVLGG